MTSSSASGSYFESLPIELHRIILANLPDFLSLRSIVIASRDARAAYNLSSQSTQCSILRNLMSNSPHLSTESRWLHAASYIRRNDPDWRDDVDAFLAYSGKDFKKQQRPQRFEAATAKGLRFHMVVEDLTRAFVRAAMHPSRSGASRPAKGNIYSLPLQRAESIRIQRALYRFQRICQMHRRNGQPLQPGARRWVEHPLGEFIRRLPSWELEELHCIYRYLILSLSFLDDDAHSAFASAQSHEGEFPNYRYRERVVSMGLIFLSKLVTAPVETRSALLEQYCGSDTQPLSDILPLDGADSSIGIQAKSRSLTIQSLFGPSAGWVLFRSTSIKDRGPAPLNALRDWGYCFWERDRLEACGVYETEKSAEVHSRQFGESTRQ